MKELKLYKDNIKVLKSGYSCYVYNTEQLNKLIELFKQATNNECELIIEKVDYYYRVSPVKQLRKRGTI